MLKGAALSSKPDLRVLIVAADRLARAGLAALLAQPPGCAVVGQVGLEADLAGALETYRPEAVLWDLGWDPTVSVERLSELGRRSLPMVALLPHESYVGEAWAAGARGLLLRDTDAARLAAALQAVAQGLAVLDPALANAVLPDRAQAPAPPPADLTPRELEVLRLLGEGLPNKAIAQALGISDHTVKYHVAALLSKMGAASRTEAVATAYRKGLLAL